MSEEMHKVNIKEKLGLNVFKPASEFHICIRAGMEGDPRLLYAVSVCPAGLYSVGNDGKVELSQDGCLECGTCKIACGDEVLEWRYPDGREGVQFRFG